jgi:DNA-directed RNA polymerase subunit RPC12/RpoP
MFDDVLSICPECGHMPGAFMPGMKCPECGALIL